MLDASLPTVAFIVANAVGGLNTGVWAALGIALLVFALRLARRESVQQAISGLFGVAIAVAIAVASGQARDYFVLGIVRNVGIGVLLLGSIPFRRPLVGVIAEFLAPSHLGALAGHRLPALRRRSRQAGATPRVPTAPVRGEPDPEPDRPWREDARLVRAYVWLTVMWGAVFLLRSAVQFVLYQFSTEDITALGAVTIVTGLPLTAAEILVTLWVVAGLHRQRVPAEPVAPAGEEPVEGRERRPGPVG